MYSIEYINKVSIDFLNKKPLKPLQTNIDANEYFSFINELPIEYGLLPCDSYGCHVWEKAYNHDSVPLKMQLGENIYTLDKGEFDKWQVDASLFSYMDGNIIKYDNATDISYNDKILYITQSNKKGILPNIDVSNTFMYMPFDTDLLPLRKFTAKDSIYLMGWQNWTRTMPDVLMTGLDLDLYNFYSNVGFTAMSYSTNPDITRRVVAENSYIDGELTYFKDVFIKNSYVKAVKYMFDNPYPRIPIYSFLNVTNSYIEELKTISRLTAYDSMFSVDLSLDLLEPLQVDVNAIGKNNILYLKGVLKDNSVDYSKFVDGTVLADLAREDVSNNQEGFFTKFVAYKDDIAEVTIDKRYIVEFQKENSMQYYISIPKKGEPLTYTLQRAAAEKLYNLDSFITSQYLNINNISKRTADLRLDNDYGIWSRGYTSRISYLDTASRQHEFYIGADKNNSFNDWDINSGIYFNAGYSYHNNKFDIKQNLFGIGMYTTFIKNGLFTDFVLSYNYIKNDLSNFLLDKKIRNNLIQASVESGYRFGDNNFWIEPSLKFNFAYGLGFNFENEKFSIKKDKKLFVSADAKLDFGAKVNDYIDVKAGFGYTYDLTTPSDTKFRYLNHDFITQVKKDKRYFINLGSHFNITDKLSIGIDFERSFKGFYNVEYQINSNFRYNF